MVCGDQRVNILLWLDITSDVVAKLCTGQLNKSILKGKQRSKFVCVSTKTNQNRSIRVQQLTFKAIGHFSAIKSIYITFMQRQEVWAILRIES